MIPSDEECEKAGITVVKTTSQHNDMRDTGSEEAKASIQGMLDKFLADTDTEAAPVEANSPKVLEPGPVAPYVPAGKEPQKETERETGKEAKSASAETH